MTLWGVQVHFYTRLDVYQLRKRRVFAGTGVAASNAARPRSALKARPAGLAPARAHWAVPERRTDTGMPVRRGEASGVVFSFSPFSAAEACQGGGQGFGLNVVEAVVAGV